MSIVDGPQISARFRLRGFGHPKLSHSPGMAQRAMGLAIVLCLLFTGCATTSAPKRAATERRTQRAVVLLAKQSDADSLAAAALLSRGTQRDGALVLISKATVAAPARPDLWWLRAQVCADTPACDPEPMERRLRELDPSNGAGWMRALVRATSAKDDEARDTTLSAIGRSDRFDIYWTTLIVPLSRATAATGKVSLVEAEELIIGALAARGIPAYGAASNACKGDRLQRSETVEVCRGVARSFEHGDTYITEMMGVAIAKRVWPEDSPQWRAAAEARRVYEYRSKYWPSLEVPDTVHAEQYLTLCSQNHREQDVLRAQLISVGTNPNPPAE